MGVLNVALRSQVWNKVAWLHICTCMHVCMHADVSVLSFFFQIRFPSSDQQLFCGVKSQEFSKAYYCWEQRVDGSCIQINPWHQVTTPSHRPKDAIFSQKNSAFNLLKQVVFRFNGGFASGWGGENGVSCQHSYIFRLSSFAFLFPFGLS